MVFNSRSRTKKRLAQVSNEIARLKEELRILTEQMVQVDDEASDARLRSLVSETPLAASEHRSASRTAEAFRRDHQVKSERLVFLERRQDELLDQLLVENR